MWYLEKGIIPNINWVIGIKDVAVLKKKLLVNLERVDKSSIKIDLEPLIENTAFVENLSRNIRTILKRQISRM